MLPTYSKITLPLLISFVACGEINSSWAQSIPLSMQKLDPINVKIEDVSYNGKKAVRVIALNEAETIAIIKDKTFENGTVELDVAGKTLPNANAGARGLLGWPFGYVGVTRFDTSAFTSAPPTAVLKINSGEITAPNTFHIPNALGLNCVINIRVYTNHTPTWWKENGHI